MLALFVNRLEASRTRPKAVAVAMAPPSTADCATQVLLLCSAIDCCCCLIAIVQTEMQRRHVIVPRRHLTVLLCMLQSRPRWKPQINRLRPATAFTCGGEHVHGASRER